MIDLYKIELNKEYFHIVKKNRINEGDLFND